MAAAEVTDQDIADLQQHMHNHGIRGLHACRGGSIREPATFALIRELVDRVIDLDRQARTESQP